MNVASALLPFRFHRLDLGYVVAVSIAGDHVFLSQNELETLIETPERLPTGRLAELKSKYFLRSDYWGGSKRLLKSRIAAKKETVLSGPALHIIVPTLHCEHSCGYCQVSRSLDSQGVSMSEEDIDRACESVFESPAQSLTVEFQGGDPLLRFDLVRRAIEKIEAINADQKRRLRFVIASTLHQLDDSICDFLGLHEVYLSTSIDGPIHLHNKNRASPGRDSYQRTVAGIELARSKLGKKSVAAVMTASKPSLNAPEEIVDQYVELGFDEIFVRPISPYGFAKKNQYLSGYTVEEYCEFYERVFNRIVEWNRKGTHLREATASVLLNKVLSPFDAGYVDLQSPSGAGLSVLVYNYDGYVYPSDEARMLAAQGDYRFRLGKIGAPQDELLSSPVILDSIASTVSHRVKPCDECAFNSFCAPDPVAAYAQFGTFDVPVVATDHCKRQTWLFDFLFRRMREADSSFMEMAYAWASPAQGEAE